MSKILVLVGSVTTAARIEKILRKHLGIHSAVVHTPATINNGGCSYSVKTDINNLSYVRQVCLENHITVRGVYVEDDMRGEKRYYAIPG